MVFVLSSDVFLMPGIYHNQNEFLVSLTKNLKYSHLLFEMRFNHKIRYFI